ncbi:MAG: AraC family transcriptional regulator, partial [Pseudomonadota bacterium]
MPVSPMADPNAHAPTELRDRLAALRAARGAPGVLGFVDTALPGARLFWSDRPVPRAPLSYAPGIALIASGRKIGFFEDRRIAYGAGRYLAVGLPLHFECETVASPEAPLLGLFLTLDPEALRALARDLADHGAAPLPPRTGLGIEPLPLGAPMHDAAIRLAGQLLRPAEAAALAPATLKEIFFHALRDRHGRVLLSQTRHARPEARIARLLRDLDAAPERFGGVDSLAEAAG